MKKSLLVVLGAALVFVFAASLMAGVTEMKIYTDQPLYENEGNINPNNNKTCRLGGKSDPASYYIVRWAVNKENMNFIEVSTVDPAAGPRCIHFHLDDAPNPNCWLDMRRKDAAEGWQDPLDASQTERITFWIKADSGTAPLWFYAQDQVQPGSEKKQKSVSVFIDGETVITIDEFGEMDLKYDNHFNGKWQFVSIPWQFMMDTDSSEVWDILPYSFVWEGSRFDQDGSTSKFTNSWIRTITWHTKAGGEDGWNNVYWADPNCLWGPAGTHKDNNEYWLDEVMFTLNAGTGITGVDGEKTVVPLMYELHEAYPNPFNPSTTVEYGLPVPNHVKIGVYNLVGQKVKTLVDADMPMGVHRVKWDATDDFGNQVPSGVYLIRMESSHYVGVKKVTLMK